VKQEVRGDPGTIAERTQLAFTATGKVGDGQLAAAEATPVRFQL
jgi:hypothetical protein